MANIYDTNNPREFSGYGNQYQRLSNQSTVSSVPKLTSRKNGIFDRLQAQNFGANDSTIVSSVMHPIKAAENVADWLQNQVNTAAGTNIPYDEANPFYTQDSKKIESAFNLAGMANLGSMPFAPKSAGGTLGTAIKPSLSDKIPESIMDDLIEAHAIAQKNAALPIEQGGLSLHPKNTPLDRARALGFDVDGTPLYHSSDEIFEGTPSGYKYRNDIENNDYSEKQKQRLLENIRLRFNNNHGGTYFSEDPNVSAIFSGSNPYTEEASNFVINRGLQLDVNNPPKGSLTKIKKIVNGSVDKQDRADFKAQYGVKLDPYQSFKNGELYFDTNRDVQNNVVSSLENDFNDKYGLDTLVFNDNLSQGSPHTSHVVFSPRQIRSPDAAFDPMKRNSANLLASLAGATTLASAYKNNDKKNDIPRLSSKKTY